MVDLHEQLSQGHLAGLRLGLAHGRLPAEEKDAVMDAFRAGDIDVLVCTTVIEVGVDVPNATVMVVMDADRFGVSQLHQLRGRIGRGRTPACACWRPGCRGVQGRRTARRGGRHRGRLLSWPSSICRNGAKGMSWGSPNPGAGPPCVSSLAEHRDLIVEARQVCGSVHAADPDHAGMALLAARFNGSDRIDFLGKA